MGKILSFVIIVTIGFILNAPNYQKERLINFAKMKIHYSFAIFAKTGQKETVIFVKSATLHKPIHFIVLDA